MMRRLLGATLICLFFMGSLCAQDVKMNPALLQGHWPANWVTCPDVPFRDYGVFHFRKTFSLTSKPGKFLVHVTGDNRYRLFVNGTPVCSGPARGDLYNWYFESVDLAPYLKAGENVIAALVWNMGVYAPVAQISNQTAFVLQGDSEAEQLVNTNGTWKVMVNQSYTPCSTDNMQRLRAYMVIGPGDQIDGSRYPWGWEQPGYNDVAWKAASAVANPAPLGYGTDNQWTLVPRPIPLMEETLQRIPAVRRAEGMDVNADFLGGKKPLTIPANKTVSILLDQTFNTTAYPELLVNGGKGTVVKMTYAEALFDKNNQKGNRDEITGKHIIGNYDVFQMDGGNNRLFRPLWFRTYRYLQLDITTADQPLVIADMYGQYTGYPFKAVAGFSSNDASMQELWKVGWRTARLCAGETYFDCPYYEQLQYEGDTRIQSLISLYVTGDDRLMRKAIMDFYHSRVPEGLTQGRYPSNRIQVIPPFSLYWVTMVYDYWMHRKDDAFLKPLLTAVSGVLNWYEQKIDEEKKMLGPMKWWNFVDYTDAFADGVPEGATNGNSSVITLQYVYTLQQAAELFTYFGKTYEGAYYKKLAATLSNGTYQQCFDKGREEMANTPEKKAFSQHAGIMAILTNTIPAKDIKAVMNKILSDNTLGPATFYYRFYLNQALKKAGMADQYYGELTPWRNMLKTGLTTFAEKPEPARSDCHAWSASPNYDFLATICGIMPDAPGFAKVLVRPAPGELTEINGSMPHPAGTITVSLKRTGKSDGIAGEVVLPPGISGRFVWNGKVVVLKPGKQAVRL